MKARLNLTIEERLLVEVKKYAHKNDTNVSELVEQFFKKILKPSKKKTIIDLVEELDRHKITVPDNLKGVYYEENRKKYGM